MKRSIFFFAISLFFLAASFETIAQNSITVNNNSNCTIWVKLECAALGCTGCNSKAYCMPPGASVTGNACSTVACPDFIIAHVCAVEDNTCSSFCDNSGTTNCVHLSWASCNGWGTSGTIVTDASCTDCEDETINVSLGTSPYTLDIN